MPINVPPARNYPRPIASLPDPWSTTNPPEGPRLIPLEIMWTSDGGVDQSVAFDVTSGGPGSPNSFTRVAALSVDNSKCGATVRFIFLDTQDTVTIPAYAPKTIVPVFSNSTKFFVIAEGTVLTEDVTRFQVHNTVPPPIAVPISQEQNAATILGVECDGSSILELLPAGTNGTLEGGVVQMSSTINGTAFSTTGYTLEDGDGRTLGVWTWAMTGEEGDGTTPENALVWTATGIHMRFTNGLFIQQSTIYGTVDVDQVYLNANFYYREG